MNLARNYAFHSTRICALRSLSTFPRDPEKINVSHANFLSNADSNSKWDKQKAMNVDRLVPGRGKLSPTASRLFKLILPLDTLTPRSNANNAKSNLSNPPTVFLLHPSQPLSHVTRLILASLLQSQPYKHMLRSTPNTTDTDTDVDTPTISFRNTSPLGQTTQWSESTDVAEFIREAARSAKFSITVEYPPITEHSHEPDDTHVNLNDILNSTKQPSPPPPIKTSLEVDVPTFEDRTHYIRKRLQLLQRQLRYMDELKRSCDKEARRGAQRMALGGFGMLIVYWGAVARLTFWDYGWDVMEPITYLSGLSTVILGYLWFLYQGREVSYSSVLRHSISARRNALYDTRGFDIDIWVDKMKEVKEIKKEIMRIKEDYEGRNGDGDGDEEEKEDGGEEEEVENESVDVDDREEARLKEEK
ncbi:hypothetical protein BDN72DRAFT_878182 [Pluteus cervinus]|uniref:Uncharacterized protein n=1 Tax=Pluteus cervinus TaxID=181527 RepID=A0ACD3AWV0_9AGAR|nr:hypothetical protein BDN72DRAFT_878182 [Pluteus cervinus]